MNENIIINKLNEIDNKINNKKEDRYLNLRDTCAYVALSPSSIYRAVASGKLKASKSSANGRLLFHIENIKKWLSNG